MPDFFSLERKQLDNVRRKFPEHDGEQLRSFIYSPYLKGLVDPMIFACGENKALVKSLGDAAYNQFVHEYLRQANNALGQIFDQNIDIDVLLESSNAREELMQVAVGEPLVDWLVGKGLPMLQDSGDRLRVSNLRELAALVRSLDYVGGFLVNADAALLPGTLYELPALLGDCLLEEGLLKTLEERLLGPMSDFINALRLDSPNRSLIDQAMYTAFVSRVAIEPGVSKPKSALRKVVRELEYMGVRSGGYQKGHSTSISIAGSGNRKGQLPQAG